MMQNPISQTFFFNDWFLLARLSPQASGIVQNAWPEIEMWPNIEETEIKLVLVSDLTSRTYLDFLYTETIPYLALVKKIKEKLIQWNFFFDS